MIRICLGFRIWDFEFLREEGPEKEEDHQRPNQKILQHQIQGQAAAEVVVDQSPGIIGDHGRDHHIELENRRIVKPQECPKRGSENNRQSQKMRYPPKILNFELWTWHFK